MKGSKLPYILFLLLMLLFNGMIFLVPFLALQGNPSAGTLYAAFAPTCHQMISRSLCLFASSSGGLRIGDCPAVPGNPYSRATQASVGGEIAYKFPVCARDVAIYLAMLIGLILLPFITKIESEDWPNKWILAAVCVPIGIDGLTQLFGLRESTNLLRLATGAIIGVVMPFYILPILNTLHAVFEEQLARTLKHKKK